MSALEALDTPIDGQGKLVLEWVAEALDLRHGTGEDPKGPLKGSPQETIPEVLDLLLRVRARADRVDELQAKATLAMGRAKRAQDEAAFQADKKLIEATREQSKKRVDFSTGKEREAEAKLDAFEERRVAHTASRLVSITQDAHKVITSCYYQLKDIRDDLRAILHALQFESSLER